VIPASDEESVMKIKVVDGVQFAVGLAMVAAGANKVPGADVMMRQLDLIGLALFWRLRRDVRVFAMNARCMVLARFATSAALVSSIAVAAAMALNVRIGLGLLVPLALLALAEAVIWARLRRAADDLHGRGVVDTLPCGTC
jgi:hypothetical protein